MPKYHVLNFTAGDKKQITSFIISVLDLENAKKAEHEGEYVVTKFLISPLQDVEQAKKLCNALCKAMNDAHEASMKILETNFMRAAHPMV